VEREELERRVEALKATLQRAGVRLTPQRVAVLREVLASEGHPDAESVFRAVKKHVPEVSLDTVYRTLWMLTDLGLITTLGSRQPRVQFDANTRPHHHYVCLRCGVARDFETGELDVARLAEGLAGFGSVETLHLEVRGLCASCAGQAG
jgi:Fur family peroxide stress response transcriptional regulator